MTENIDSEGSLVGSEASAGIVLARLAPFLPMAFTGLMYGCLTENEKKEGFYEVIGLDLVGVTREMELTEAYGISRRLGKISIDYTCVLGGSMPEFVAKYSWYSGALCHYGIMEDMLSIKKIPNWPQEGPIEYFGPNEIPITEEEFNNVIRSEILKSQGITKKMIPLEHNLSIETKALAGTVMRRENRNRYEFSAADYELKRMGATLRGVDSDFADWLDKQALKDKIKEAKAAKREQKWRERRATLALWLNRLVNKPEDK
jgi:hypothetical protein